MRIVSPFAPPPSLLDSLNLEQAAAARLIDGPLLVLAGAGTGKTSTLTARIAEILRSGAASAPLILAVTFTRKAGDELRERLVTRLGPTAAGVEVGTFHAISARLLRDAPEIAGLGAGFEILDEHAAASQLREAVLADFPALRAAIPDLLGREAGLGHASGGHRNLTGSIRTSAGRGACRRSCCRTITSPSTAR